VFSGGKNETKSTDENELLKREANKGGFSPSTMKGAKEVKEKEKEKKEEKKKL